MTDENFKNAIFGLFVILIILIGLYFYNTKTVDNEDMTTNTQTEETRERTRKRVVKQQEEEKEDNSESQEVKQLVEEAYRNMINHSGVTAYGYLQDGSNPVVCKLDLANNIGYVKVQVGDYVNDEEVYAIYRNGTFIEAAFPIDGNGAMSYTSSSRVDLYTARQKIGNTFLAFVFKDNDLLPRYNCVIEDDNYEIDEQSCYKVQCFLVDELYKTIFISKDSTLILEIIDQMNNRYIDYKINYDSNGIEISNAIEEQYNRRR